ncbi:MAG: leucine-rich repeat protein [Clostridium sp.]|nr:leucine-rich repeat protein [Clostridium sp.]
MKKIRSILLYFIMIMMAVFLFLDVRVQDVKAAAYTSGSWQYNINGGYVEIAGYTGSLSNVTIPDSLNGYTVKYIANYAFADNYSLKTVTIPKNIKSIGNYAFKNCAYLTTVNYNAIECTSMYGYDVFKECDNFTTLKIGDNVESLPSYAFDSTNITSVTIPNKIKEIPYSCFKNCTKLTSVTLGSSIKKIGGYAFYNNSSLKAITIPSTVEIIESYAFKDCAYLVTGGFVIYGKRGSYAEKYANSNSITFKEATNKNLLISSFIADKASPQVAGTSITLIAKATGTGTLQYRFRVGDGSGNYSTIKNYSTSNIAIWNANYVGNKILCVDVKDDNGQVITKTMSYVVKPKSVAPIISSFTASKTSPQYTGTVITLTAKATGNGTLQYRFRVGDGKGNYSTIKDYSTTNTVTWTTKSTGSKVLYVDVKDSRGQVTTKTMSYVIKAKPVAPVISSFTTSKVSPQYTGTSITLKAKATGNGTLQYRFRVGDGKGNYSTIKNYSTTNTATWNANYVGTKVLCVDVKDSNGKETTKTMNYVIKEKSAALTISSFTTNKTSPQVKGTAITLTAKATGTGTIQYRFRVGDGAGNYTTIKNYSTSNTAIWNANYVGRKVLCVDVKDSTGKETTKTMNYVIK